MSDIIEAKFTEVRERSLDTITAEIITITRQTQTMILHSAIEVGRRLCEAKEQVHHGEWGNYLAERVNFSVSTANNFMRVFKEYGDDQIDLFGTSKSQTFGNEKAARVTGGDMGKRCFRKHTRSTAGGSRFESGIALHGGRTRRSIGNLISRSL